MKLLLALLLFSLMTVAVQVAVTWHRQGTSHDMTMPMRMRMRMPMTDIVIDPLLLPMAVIGPMLAMRRAWRGVVESQRGLLSAAGHPRGRMPGAGAAALDLAPSTWPDAPDGGPDPLRLHAASVQRRSRSIDAGGRVCADGVRAVLAQAPVSGRLAPRDVGAMVCDADQHSARPAELDDATPAQLPRLDPTADMRLVGTGTGHRGFSSSLPLIAAAAAAAAAEHARATNRPTVALARDDAFMRLALVVQPNGIALS